MASNFLQPITIGISGTGAIVAHGRDDRNAPITSPPAGYLNRVDIGNKPLSRLDSPINPYFIRPRGFIGRPYGDYLTPCEWQCYPLPARDPDLCFPDASWILGFTPDLWLHGALNSSQPDPQTINQTTLGMVDSVIRAQRVDTLYLRQLRSDKGVPPRVEAELIGDLQIGDVREGVIWSGNYEWTGPSSFIFRCLSPFRAGNPDQPPSTTCNGCVRDCEYDPTNDFASIVYSHIGCIGHQGQVWFRDTPFFQVDRSCLGGLHMPVLNANQTIWIGDRLGRDARPDMPPDQSEFCSCIQNDPEPVDPAASCLMICATPAGMSVCGPWDLDTELSQLPRHPLFMLRGLISIGDHIARPPLFSDGARAIRGQIILNGGNHPLNYILAPNTTPIPDFRWEGKVTTGPARPRQLIGSSASSPCGSNDITPLPDVAIKRGDNDSNNPNNPLWDLSAPYYASLPSVIGGGSIGQAPFHIHDQACVPPNGEGVSVSDRRFATVTTSDFLTTGAPIVIKVRFYGPVQATNAAGAPYSWPDPITGAPRVGWQNPANGFSPAMTIYAVDENDHTSRIDATRLFGIHGPGEPGWAENNRTIGLSSRSTLIPRPGIYCIVPKPNFRCSGVRDIPTVLSDALLADAPYLFRVAPDCNFNGINDYLDIFRDPTLDPDGDGMICTPVTGTNVCRADFNRNGVIEVQDIFNFLTAWFELCTQTEPPPSHCRGSADFNTSGSITVQDIFDFLSAWFAATDVNCHLP